jgi:hypothetical protein
LVLSASSLPFSSPVVTRSVCRFIQSSCLCSNVFNFIICYKFLTYSDRRLSGSQSRYVRCKEKSGCSCLEWNPRYLCLFISYPSTDSAMLAAQCKFFQFSSSFFIWNAVCGALAATDMNLRVSVAGNWNSCTHIHADTLALRFSPLMTSCDKLKFKWFSIQRVGRSYVT